MNNQLTTAAADVIVARRENLATIIQAGPDTYSANLQSSRRCTDAGQALLDEIAARGMSDELDQRIALHIEKTRKTLKVMNERRAPITKLFDQVRAEFTTLENSINPAQDGTTAARLQQLRNAFAAQKREEAERRRQAELAAQELQRAKDTYRATVEEDYRRAFNARVTAAVGELTTLNASVTLDNYQAVTDTLTGYSTTLPADWCPPSRVRLPFNLSPDEAAAIRTDTLACLRPTLARQYEFEIGEYRRELLDKLPSKKAELERMATADAAEAARLRAQLAQREAEEAARKEQQRRQAEDADARKAQLDKANAEIAGLFDQAHTDQAYTPKAKVTKKIHIDSPAGYLALLTLWWQREGCNLSVDELAKTFKKQVTYCEKLANKENILVESAAVRYIDEVKAQ